MLIFSVIKEGKCLGAKAAKLHGLLWPWTACTTPTMRREFSPVIVSCDIHRSDVPGVKMVAVCDEPEDSRESRQNPELKASSFRRRRSSHGIPFLSSPQLGCPAVHESLVTTSLSGKYLETAWEDTRRNASCNASLPITSSTANRQQRIR